MSGPLTQEQLREKLRAAVKEAGSQRAVADACCVAPNLVSMCLNGKTIGNRIANRLGYRRVVAYVPMEGDR